MRVALLLVVLLVAGCLGAPSVPTPAPSVGGKTVALPGGTTLQIAGQKAGVSTIATSGSDAAIDFPAGVLVKDAKGELRPVKGPFNLAAGASVTFLPPYGAHNLTLKVNGADVPVTLEEGDRLVSGDFAVDLMKIQRAQFPHRTPSMPNYAKSEAYFAAFFKALNYTVELNTYPGGAITLPAADKPGPGSFESVVATKKGTTKADRYLVFGGHFDVVEQTTEGAFDNTAGAIATLVVAQAFANLTTEHSIIFGEWGGEEDGLMGSEAWLSSHPQLVPFIDGYVNFDVTSLAWPAPKVDPAPIVVASGPDGPIADNLAKAAQDIEKTYLQSGAKFIYESVAQGQANGHKVNAQSDHSSFMSRGIPVYFPFTSKVPDAFTIIHSEKDTVENMTKYSLKGVEGIGQDATPAEMAEGEWYLARSFETQMGLGFYFVILVDDGTITVSPAPSPLPS